MKDAYYFTHDSNAKDDPKCVLLIEQLGLEGYGIYWILIEMLRDQPDYKYPLILLPAIARRYNTSTEKIKAVILNYGLFFVEEEQFFLSKSLIERMLNYDESKKVRSLAGKKGNEIRWAKEKIANVSHSESHSDCNSSLLDKKRIDKKRLEEIIYYENKKLNSVFLDYLEMRKKIKKPATEFAIKLAISELEKLAGNDESKKISILEKSILNNWQGLFQLKETEMKEKTNYSVSKLYPNAETYKREGYDR